MCGITSAFLLRTEKHGTWQGLDNSALFCSKRSRGGKSCRPHRGAQAGRGTKKRVFMRTTRCHSDLAARFLLEAAFDRVAAPLIEAVRSANLKETMRAALAVARLVYMCSTYKV